MEETTQKTPLRRGWTTGTCATAAARAAYEALFTGNFPDPVDVLLPNGSRPAFSLATTHIGAGEAQAGIIKDAGDDPDATHGALILSTVRRGAVGTGVTFKAGPGIGTVTRPGLALPPGEPAINPVPREMMRMAITEASKILGTTGDVEIEISIPGGEEIARSTLNGRLGIVGGLSILGTTGIVIPYSCAAWINTSERAIQQLYQLPEVALIDMGDFVGGMLKYLRRHPVRRVTVGGGFAKMTKLGQGLLDVHSRRGEVDLNWLSDRILEAGGKPEFADAMRQANAANEVLDRCRAAGIDIATPIAEAAWKTAAKALGGSDIDLDVVVVTREGEVIARTPPRNVV
jgi:cobalt-precorrin-5B (C1)-methyltransferase